MRTNYLPAFARILLFFFSCACVRANVDPAWILPENGASYGKWVPCVIEVSNTVASPSASVTVYSGTTVIANMFPSSVSQGLRRYVGFLPLSSTAATHVLTANVSDGFTTVPLQGPTISVTSPAPSPDFSPEPTTHKTAVSMVINASVDPRGTLPPATHRIRVQPVYWSDPATRPAVYWEYGTSTSYGSFDFARRVHQGEYFYGDPNSIVEKQYHFRTELLGLTPETTYHFRLVVNGVPGPDQVATTTANNLPEPANDVAVLGPDNQVDVYVMNNDLDETKNLDVQNLRTTLITVTTAPALGTVQIHSSGRYLRYIAGPDFADSDEFTYTIRDPFGGEATAKVTVLSWDAHIRSIQGNYSTIGINYSNGSNGELVATLNVSVNKNGSYSGALVYFDARYPFSGAFNHALDAMVNLRIPRAGRQPIALSFIVSSVGSLPYPNPPVIYASLYDESDGLSIEFDMAPVQVRPGDSIPEAGQYAVSLPNPEVATGEPTNSPAPKELGIDTLGKPQGHGYSALKTNKRGRSTVIGRTGDNQPFSAGTRLRTDRKILVAARSGVKKAGSISGLLAFSSAQDTACAGTLRWSGPARGTGAYQAGFGFALNATGLKSDERTVSDEPMKIVIRDHSGAVLAQEIGTLSNQTRFDTGAGKPNRIKLTINQKTGVFSGSLRRTGARSLPISGVLKPDGRHGLGVAGKTGFDGPVELLAPE